MKRLLAVLAIALTVAGCSSSGSSPTASGGASPGPTSPTAAVLLAGCGASILPAHYVVDSAHSGKLTAHTYSQSADVQAALVFDQLKDGQRKVYVHHAHGAKSPIDGVASCVTMTFPSAHVANRFFLSYRALRSDAGSLVSRLAVHPAIHGLAGTTAYREREQSFRGYHIASTTVIEAAGRDGANLDIASVAGMHPSPALARRLLASMVGSS